MHNNSHLGKYFFKRLPMWVANSPENFQQETNALFHGFQLIRVYIDYHLVFTRWYWTDHVNKLELTLNKTKKKWIKINVKNYFLEQTGMEYLDSWVTHNGVKPVDKNASN